MDTECRLTRDAVDSQCLFIFAKIEMAAGEEKISHRREVPASGNLRLKNLPIAQLLPAIALPIRIAGMEKLHRRNLHRHARPVQARHDLLVNRPLVANLRPVGENARDVREHPGAPVSR
jgi:hypothetical protein